MKHEGNAGKPWLYAQPFGDREPASGFIPHAFQPRMESIEPTPRILIQPRAYDEMRYIVQLSPKEVGWFGCVTELPEMRYRIERVFLFDQEVSEVETELSQSALSLFGTEMLMKGDEGDDILKTLRFWGHSHVWMGTTPSPKDDSTMEMIRTSSPVPWWIRGIFNKAGTASFSFYNFAKGYKVHDVPWQLVDEEKPEVGLAITRELESKVRQSNLLFGSRRVRAERRSLAADGSTPLPGDFPPGGHHG